MGNAERRPQNGEEKSRWPIDPSGAEKLVLRDLPARRVQAQRAGETARPQEYASEWYRCTSAELCIRSVITGCLMLLSFPSSKDTQ